MAQNYEIIGEAEPVDESPYEVIGEADDFEEMFAEPAEPSPAPGSMSEALARDMYAQMQRGAAMPSAVSAIGRAIFENVAKSTEAMGRLVASPYAAIPYLAPGGESYTDALKRIRDARTFDTSTQTGKAIERGVAAAMEPAENVLGMIPAGLAGIGGVVSGQPLEQTVRDIGTVREQGLGELAFQKTGSPALAAAGEALPVAAAALAPQPMRFRSPFPADGYGDLKASPGPVGDVPEGYGGLTPTAQTFRNAESPDDIPRGEARQIAETLMARDVPKTVSLAQPSAATVAAFEELGIKNYTPAMVSESVQFRKAQSGAKADAESPLAAYDQSVYDQLVEVSEDLINTYGTTDRAQLDADISVQTNNVLNDLRAEIDDGYEFIRQNTDSTRPVMPNSTLEYLFSEASKLRKDYQQGLRDLPPELRNVVDEFFRFDADGNIVGFKEPTYGTLDQLRREIGAKGAGASLRGEQKGLYDQLYKNILLDLEEANQIVLPDGTDIAAVQSNVTNLAKQRFGLLEEMEKAFGKPKMDREPREFNLQRMDTAVNKLVKGDLEDFNQVMAALPTPDQRQTVAASMIANLLAPGSQKGTKIKRNFVDSLDALDRNPKAKDALFRELPPEARERFDLIAEAYRGYAKSKEFDNVSGTANAITQALLEGRLIDRIYGRASNTALGLIPGTEPRSPRDRGRARIEAADEFLASRELRAFLRQYAANARTREAEAKLYASQPYRDWVEQLTDEEAKRLAKGGLFAYLVAETEE